METAQRKISQSQASFRAFLFTTLFVVSFGAPSGDAAAPASTHRHSIPHFRHDMRRHVRADHPAIKPVADAIRAITTDPLQQIVVVNDVAHLLVDYDEDTRIYGSEEFHASLDEMIARRRTAGWAYLRDDCDGRAVFAAHLLAALGIPWRLEASHWKAHAWVRAKVRGSEYDLLDLRKGARETDRLSYKLIGKYFVKPSNPPPSFSWRKAWAQRTNRNVTIGKTLGMLTLDSTATAMHTRYAKDWTTIAPDSTLPPPDDARALFSGVAGFPFGEPLPVGMLANAKPASAASGSVSLAGSTGSSSAPTDSSPPAPAK